MTRKKSLLAGIGVVCFAVALVWLTWLPTSAPPTTAIDPGLAKSRESIPVPVVKFTDVTRESRIAFQHHTGATGAKFLPEAMGSGVVVIDFDADGKPDLLFVNSCPWPGQVGPDPPPTSQLYRNLGSCRFEDVTRSAGLDIPFYGMGGTAGDYDNDGFLDLFVTAVGGDRLFHNEADGSGGRKFVEVTMRAGVGGPGGWPKEQGNFLNRETPLAFSSSAAFFDYDGDGLLDLFVARYVTWSPADDRKLGFQLAGLGRAYGPPTSFEGAKCSLYRNLGGGRFADVSRASGVEVLEHEGVGQGSRLRAVGKSLGVCVLDIDDDGWPDVFVANDTVRNFLFKNVPANAGRRFEEIGLASGAAYADGRPRGGMGVDEATYRSRQRSLAVGNFANEPNTFFEQDRPGEPLFADSALAVGVAGPSRTLLKFGVLFFDYDLDGRQDFFTCNGHLEPEISKVQTGQTYAQPPQLFWNTGGPRCFEPVTPESGGEELFSPMVGRGCAYADLDGDGDLDLILTSNGGSPRVLRNDLTGASWIRLQLVGDGTTSNRDAIGAVVTLESGGNLQRQEVRSGRGYLSQSELTLTFGLGGSKPDRILIRWPGRDAGPPTVLNHLQQNQTQLIRQVQQGKP